MNITVVASSALESGPDLFRMVRAYGRSAGTDETAVAASLLCQAWAVKVTGVAIASLVDARRMPDVAASNTVITSDGEGRPTAASLVIPRFAAMAGDDADADPPAEIVADEEALFAVARARLFDDHLALLVDALHDRFPVGERLLWGNVAAAAAGRFAALSAEPARRGRRFGAERLMRDARHLLDAPGSPTEGLAELFPVVHEGRTRLFVRRLTCCLRYRLPAAPPTCLSCRLVREPERRRRIAQRLAVPVG